MSDQEINIAIAESVGWNGINPVNGFIRVPNYCNDLNAMHAAVATLSNDEYGDEDGFTVMLSIVTQGAVQPPNAWRFRPMQEATARQRAEAFLKAQGLWNECGN